MKQDLSSKLIIMFAFFTFSLTACGGGGGGDAAPTPTSEPAVNQSPIAASDWAVVEMNTFVDISVLANDSDPDGDTLVLASVTEATNGAVSINGASTIHYIPTAGFAGNDSFSYSISDGKGGTATGSVSVYVSISGGRSIERASIATDGTEGNGDCWMGVSSLDGRYIAFYSGAANIVPGASEGHVIVRDRFESQTVLVSTSAAGERGNLGGQQPAVSGNGQYIAFSSFSSNLVPNDTNERSDVFVKNMLTGAIERISIASDGTQGNEASFAPSISTDGRYVAFYSGASNLVSSATGIFVRDRQTGQTTHIGVGGGFDRGPGISDDARYVAYSSLGQVILHDRQTGQNSTMSVDIDGTPGNADSDFPVISGNGRFVAFTSLATNLVAGDTNGNRDVFVRDTLLDITKRVSIASDGTEGNGAAPDFEVPGISSDGQFVVFNSSSSNLVSGDTNGLQDTFIHNMDTGETRRVNVSSTGSEANGASGDNVRMSISANGKYIIFTSTASNLIAGDTNGHMDVYVGPNPFIP